MRIVTSYINPDLDGVASAVVYATYLAPLATQPVFVGRPSVEAARVLERLGLTDSVRWTSPGLESWEDIALVDCHHPAQLPHVPNRDAVSIVIDHHPDGDAAAFPNASVQNESVGAAATLVAEFLGRRERGGALTPAHAALLAAAIASNTLDFEAPSTTARDHEAYSTLARRAALEVSMDELRLAMREARNALLSLSSREVIENDCKLIETPRGVIAVAQVEGDGARLIAGREGLLQQLEYVVVAARAVAGVLSLVDTATSTTTLVTADAQIRRAMLPLGPTTGGDGILVLPYIALRKTHIIPALTSGGA